MRVMSLEMMLCMMASPERVAFVNLQEYAERQNFSFSPFCRRDCNSFKRAAWEGLGGEGVEVTHVTSIPIVLRVDFQMESC